MKLTRVGYDIILACCLVVIMVIIMGVAIKEIDEEHMEQFREVELQLKEVNWETVDVISFTVQVIYSANGSMTFGIPLDPIPLECAEGELQVGRRNWV